MGLGRSLISSKIKPAISPSGSSLFFPCTRPTLPFLLSCLKIKLHTNPLTNPSMTRIDTLPQPPHPTLIAPAPLKAVRLFTKNGAPPRHAGSTRSVASAMDDENKENVQRVRVELMRSLNGMPQKGVETEENGERYSGVADGW